MKGVNLIFYLSAMNVRPGPSTARISVPYISAGMIPRAGHRARLRLVSTEDGGEGVATRWWWSSSGKEDFACVFRS